MIKKVLTVSAVTAMLLLTGCSSNDAEGHLQNQQDIDSGNYEAVIERLEDGDNTNEELMLLASAYMGRAGVSFSDIIKIMVESTKDDSGDGFANFAQAIAENKTSTTLTDLGKATESYEEIMISYGKECTAEYTLTDAEESICLYQGLSYTVKTASTLSYLGDLDSFGEDVASDDGLKASECAMQYAYEGTDANIDVLCTATPGADVTFDNGKTYTGLSILVNAIEYKYLMTGLTPNQTIITDGYCTNTDFSTRVNEEFVGSYVCPINESAGEDDIVALDVLVDTLNNGTDAVIAAVGSDDEDSDIAADIEEFKKEVLGVDENANIDGIEITEQHILDYLAAQN